MIHYRSAIQADLSILCDLDLKCHERAPETNEWWTQIAANPQADCFVACKSRVTIGMIVWEKQAFRLPEFKTKQTTLHIHKICVRTEFRGQKIAQRLLAQAHEEARKKGCLYMTMSVPEYLCIPGQPDNVSDWLNKLQFKASIILPEKVDLYGIAYDQFLFVHKMKL